MIPAIIKATARRKRATKGNILSRIKTGSPLKNKINRIKKIPKLTAKIRVIIT
jgi:hypothetical protein